jgi:hypothetical protein
MDEIQLRKALAKLQSLIDNLPNGDLEEKYVKIYHTLLTDIQKETGHDLSYFVIPESELNRKLVMTSFDDYGDGESLYSDNRFCDREIFMINLRGAVNFINSFSQGSGRRAIGFTQQE